MGDWYAEAAGDNDLNPGTSPGAGNAFRTFDQLITTINFQSAGEHTLNLKYGEIYYTTDQLVGNGISGLAPSAPIQVRAYGDPAVGYPSVRAFQVLANADWTATAVTGGGNTVYAYALSGNATTDDGRLYVDDEVATYLDWNTDVATTFLTTDTMNNHVAIDPTSDVLYYCSSSNPVTDGRLFEAAVNDGTLDQVVRWSNADYWAWTNVDIQGGFNVAMNLVGNSARLNRNMGSARTMTLYCSKRASPGRIGPGRRCQARSCTCSRPRRTGRPTPWTRPSRPPPGRFRT